MNENQKLGALGEDLACRALLENGYTLLGRNVRTPFGEIDVLGCDGSFTALIEVKTRRTRRFGLPEEAITRSKQATMIRMAQWLLLRRKISEPIRFDVVAVDYSIDPTEIRLIQGAFDA